MTKYARPRHVCVLLQPLKCGARSDFTNESIEFGSTWSSLGQGRYISSVGHSSVGAARPKVIRLRNVVEFRFNV